MRAPSSGVTVLAQNPGSPIGSLNVFTAYPCPQEAELPCQPCTGGLLGLALQFKPKDLQVCIPVPGGDLKPGLVAPLNSLSKARHL